MICRTFNEYWKITPIYTAFTVFMLHFFEITVIFRCFYTFSTFCMYFHEHFNTNTQRKEYYVPRSLYKLRLWKDFHHAVISTYKCPCSSSVDEYIILISEEYTLNNVDISNFFEVFVANKSIAITGISCHLPDRPERL